MISFRVIRLLQVGTGTLRVGLACAGPGAAGTTQTVLLLRAPDGTVSRVPAPLTVEGERARLGVDLDLATLVRGPGTWTLGVEVGDGVTATDAAITDDGDPRTAEVTVPGTPVQEVCARVRDRVIVLDVASRDPYAEAAHVAVVDGELRLRCRVLGSPLPGSTVSVVARGSESGTEHRVEAAPEGDSVAVALPFLDLPITGPEHWTLHLEAGGARFAVRRCLDEVTDRRRAYVYPRTPVTSDGLDLAVFPVFDDDGALLLNCVRRPPATGPAGPAAPSGTAPGEAAAATRSRQLAHRLLRLLFAGLERLARRRRPRGSRGLPAARRVYFLLDTAYGGSGLHRTVINLANHLVEDHDVELISLHRPRQEPYFRIDPRVRIRVVRDQPGPGGPGWVRTRLDARRSFVVDPADFMFAKHSLWTDLQLVRVLQSLRPGVLVSTQVGFNVFAARFARAGVATAGQEHKNLTVRGKLLPLIREHYPKLDAVVVLSRGDEQDFAELLAGTGTRVVRIPNASVPPDAADADLRNKVVIAAGNYVADKGFDLLIRACVPVAERHPDWRVHIYGGGPQEERLRRMIAQTGLAEQVQLMPRTAHLEEKLSAASIFVLSSRQEGFGMVIVEAMAVGVPVISFDCPRGPGDIITDGVDGILVPDRDTEALSAALLDLVEDPDRRHALAAAARAGLTRYELATIGDQWRTLFRELTA